MQHLNYPRIYYFANNNSSLENDYLILLFEKSIPYLHKDIFFRLTERFLVHLSLKFVQKIG